MWVQYGASTATGPVREHNEDSIGVWHPSDVDARRARGTVIVLADGVGGHNAGEVASSMAVDICLREFATAPDGTAPNQVLWRMFNIANLAVLEAAAQEQTRHRMATTLTAAIFRHNQITVGHVGDCRAFLIRENTITRITNDHSYAGVQLRLGLISAEEAAASPNRSMLTRTVGQDPMLRVDYHALDAQSGDRYVQCCDGIHNVLTEGEIFQIALQYNTPIEAAEALVAAAIRRKSEDNLSAQVVLIQSVEKRTRIRGEIIYEPVKDEKMGTELEVGQTLDGRFQTTDLISRSGMAQIFKAIDKEKHQTVAIKVPLMQFESDPGFYSRFEREEQIGRKLQHPYIIHIEPLDDTKSRPYIVMEYLEGQTLAHLMRSVTPMPEPDAIKIAARICDALQYMHANEIVHRDLKPDNIMICDDGSLRIMDFGIAKFQGMRRLTFGGLTPTMGTPDYMAPEQVKGKRGDNRTDIYSLGAMLYEMATGRPPFEGVNPFLIMNARLTGDPIAPRMVNPNITPQLEEIILHAMEREPADRYQDAREMQAELDHPQNVKITGRSEKLIAPKPWKARWTQARLYIIICAIPIAIFVIAWLCTHLRWR